MLTTQTTPETLRTAVCKAIGEGAWTSADVVASVASDYATDRAAIMAVLWDLVDEGYLRYDGSGQLACFRPC
jgi:hypothetical protein